MDWAPAADTLLEDGADLEERREKAEMDRALGIILHPGLSHVGPKAQTRRYVVP